MSVVDLLQKLKPIYAEDAEDWDEAINGLSHCESVTWQGSAGLDCTPLLELVPFRIHGMHQAPSFVRRSHPNNSLHVFSDYGTRWLDRMKRLYQDLDDVDPADLGFRAFTPCTPTIYEMLNGYENSDVECEEIIPLKLFEDCELLRAEYPNVHSSATSSAIPDDKWHAVYLELSMEFKGQRHTQGLLYFHLENLLCLEQVFAAHHIPIDIFYAKKVQGKSGSWEFIHSEDSKLMHAVQKLPVELRPKIWAADCVDFTTEGEQLFGFASWYEPPWCTNNSEWSWIRH